MIYVIGSLVLAAVLIAYWVWMGKERYEWIEYLAETARRQEGVLEPWEAPRIVRGPYDWERRGDFDA